MAPKEPTRAQLSSRLTYTQHTPAFLRRLQSQYSGRRNYNDDNEDDQDNDHAHADPEFEDYDRGSGRPPIPRRPSIPERPHDDPGSADEDDDDERPQVVVLKEGKHLTEREAENIRRKAKGLPPLPDPVKVDAPEDTNTSKPKESASGPKTKSKMPSLTFSTSAAKSSTAKRKLEAIGQLSDEKETNGDDSRESSNSNSKKSKPSTNKKQKKTVNTKTLLSFGDDA